MGKALRHDSRNCVSVFGLVVARFEHAVYE